jgi:hypothetical protein
MAPKLTLYVDTVSPFAYLAYYILRVREQSLLQSCSETLSRLHLNISAEQVEDATGGTVQMPAA